MPEKRESLRLNIECPSSAPVGATTARGKKKNLRGFFALLSAPAPIVSAKEDVPQYGDYHSTARDEMRRTFKLPGAKTVFLEPEGSLQA